MAMAASSALQQPDRCLLLAPLRRRRHLLRMLPPPLLVPTRCRRGAVRFSSGDGGGKGGSAGAVEKRSVPVPVPVPVPVADEKAGGDGGEGAEEVEVEVEAGVDGGELELRWPPWEGLPERYRLMGATSLAFVICNMDKVTLVSPMITISDMSSHLATPVLPFIRVPSSFA
jgi:ACS family sodium-dependent inorganic phosphate cotransporter